MQTCNRILNRSVLFVGDPNISVHFMQFGKSKYLDPGEQERISRLCPHRGRACNFRKIQTRQNHLLVPEIVYTTSLVVILPFHLPDRSELCKHGYKVWPDVLFLAPLKYLPAHALMWKLQLFLLGGSVYLCALGGKHLRGSMTVPTGWGSMVCIMWRRDA